MVDWYNQMRKDNQVTPDEIIFKTLAEYGHRSGDEVIIATIKYELEKEKMGHLIMDSHRIPSHSKINI